MQNETKSFLAPVFGLGLLAVGGFTIYQSNQMSHLQHDFAAYQRELVVLRTNVSTADGELQKTLAAVSAQLSVNKTEGNLKLAKAQALAQRHADILAGKIEKEQQAQGDKINAEFTKVKQTSLEAAHQINGITTEVGAVKSEVGTVKNEVASAKSEIEKTLNDLQRVRGDMGVMSGYIATNGKEIQALRDMGDRNIFEFKLAKNGLQKIGGVQLTLKKTDIKHNRYTMDVQADDKRVEKKDKTANEPVQFYVASRARQPFEIVVNQVGKETISGYLAVPKVELSRK